MYFVGGWWKIAKIKNRDKRLKDVDENFIE